MIDRNNVIKNALLKCGEVSNYNDDRSEEYANASLLLKNIINTVASKNDFTFNSTTAKLTKGGVNVLGYNRFNLPVDFLNKIAFIDSTGYIEGEFIYSTDDEVFLQYCRAITLEEYPNYMLNYLIYALAVELAESNNSYVERLSILNQRLAKETTDIYSIEYRPTTRNLGV